MPSTWLRGVAIIFVGAAMLWGLGGVVPDGTGQRADIADKNGTLSYNSPGAVGFTAALEGGLRGGGGGRVGGRSAPWSWLARRRQDFAAMGSGDGCRLTRGWDRSAEVSARLTQLCGRRTLRVLHWSPGPGFGSEEAWRAGAARAYTSVDPRLAAWREAVKQYLALDAGAYPPGTAPDNVHFFPPLPPNGSSAAAWAAGHDPCNLPGVALQVVANNELLPDADVVFVDYPFLLPSAPPGMYLPRTPGLLSVMFFSGESADSYPEIVAGRFRDLFDVRIGSPRGHFDFAGYNSYTVSPEILSNSTSPQLATLRAAGGWPTDRPLVAMAVSHCAVGTTRGDYFRDLMAVMRVDSFGSCLNNAKVTAEVVAAAVAAPKLLCTGCDWPYRKEKLALLRNYPFALAFENSNCYDSVTEKIYDVLLAGAVPVYLGAPNVEEWAPAGSYIDARLFSGPEELAEYLTVLASDPERYAQYHAWRLQPAGGDAFRLMRMTLAGVNNQCIVFKLGSIPCGVGQ